MYTRGEVLTLQKRFDQALESYQRAIEILERSANPQLLATPLILLGELQLARDRPAEALAPLERAVGILDVHPPTCPQNLATARADWGKALWAAGDRRRGRRMVEAARAEFAALKVAENPSLAETDAWLKTHR
jgi:tetratricopeptide (TPR) repeat protein